MLEEDRTFLREYVNFVCLTHPIAAIALRRAAVAADEVAVLAKGRTHRVDQGEAEKAAMTGNTAALAQTYVVARLLAELAAAIEDLGALLDAVRHRDRRGLFLRYLHSRPGQVDQVWDSVLAGVGIADLLALPPLASIEPEPPAAIVTDYEALARALPQIASVYRSRADAELVHFDPGVSIRPDDLNIVTEILDGNATGSGATLADAYNKIKHRFTVFNDIQPIGMALSANGRRAVYVRYPRHPAKADVLYQNIMTVAAAGGELAALLLWLDEVGLVPPGK